MDTPIQNIIITISGVEDNGSQIKLKSQDKKTYSFFKNKRDGGETVAYQNFKNFKPGDTVELGVKEVPYKDGTIKNVMNIKAATSRPAQQTMSQPKVVETVEYAKNKDRENYEKCCSIWAASHFDSAISRLNEGQYWELFQAIRKDGEKRFATGFAKAEAIFRPEPIVSSEMADQLATDEADMASLAETDPGEVEGF